MTPFPPPRVLWPKMLKACSKADLDLLRCEGLIQIAAEGFHVEGDPNEERVEFLRRIELETRRRKRMAVEFREVVPRRKRFPERKVVGAVRGASLGESAPPSIAI